MILCCGAQAPALTELNKQFANTLNHSIRTGSPCKMAQAVVCRNGTGVLVEDGTSDSDCVDDEAAQPDLDFDKMMCAFVLSSFCTKSTGRCLYTACPSASEIIARALEY